MQQEELFFDRIEDALAAVIDRCGGRKKFASEMFPDKPQRDAHNLVDAMLNPERRERFAPAQLVYVASRGRAVGCHAVMQYLARDLGYAEPEPIEPRDEAAELQRQFIESTRTLQRMAERIERLSAPGPMLRGVA